MHENDELIKKHVRGAYIEEALRFTVDSILGGNLRILVANLARPVKKQRGIAGLAQLDMWEEEKEDVVERKEAAAMIGVKPAHLLERRVFVRIQELTFEITKHVRKESKRAYKPLLLREIVRSRGKSEGFR